MEIDNLRNITANASCYSNLTLSGSAQHMHGATSACDRNRIRQRGYYYTGLKIRMQIHQFDHNETDSN